MKKKILCLCLTVLLLTAMLPVSAAGTVLTIKSPASLPDVGKTFTVTVDISGNPGLCAAQFTLTYDQTALECTEANLGKVLSGTLAATNPAAEDGAIIAAASAEPVKGEGALGEFTFQVKKAAAAGDFGLAEVVLTGDNGKAITFTVEGGELEEPKEPGGQQPGGQQQGQIPPTPKHPEDPVQPGGAGEQTTAETGAFSDVAADYWGTPYIAEAVSRGLFSGYPDGTFQPDANIIRADFVTVLWRSAGSPEPKAAAAFTDVPANAYYAKAVAWAAENGYVNGTSATTFSPNGELERQAAMTILFRYSGGQSGMELMLSGLYDSGFADSASIASWAKAAMYWGYYNGIISGVGENLLSPTTGATRAQLAKILVNYLDKFAI